MKLPHSKDPYKAKPLEQHTESDKASPGLTPDEAKLEAIADRLLSTPPEKRKAPRSKNGAS